MMRIEVRKEEMCDCDVRRRMDLGLIPAIPMILDGFIRVCPWCDRINPSWAKQQRAEARREKETVTREKVLEKVEAAVNPMAGPTTMRAKPKRKVWVVVRILRGLEGTSDICVFDTKEKAEDFRRALSMADTYDCVTRMYEREVIE